MLNSKELINLIKEYNPKCDEDLIARAYDYGKNYHEGQFRASGEKYFSHPIEVAKILIGQRLDDATIVTAILHDTVEFFKNRKFLRLCTKGLNFPPFLKSE